MLVKNPTKTTLAIEVARMHLDMAVRAASDESYTSIGQSYGISRQRVEKIINRLTVNQNQSKAITV